ncbi:hypothetical protein BDR04DRAFT_633857 [Suillus decipiens]|nr:hypothetical protein BDR04DRAFT_633857 [Suillus decipiens]
MRFHPQLILTMCFMPVSTAAAVLPSAPEIQPKLLSWTRTSMDIGLLLKVTSSQHPCTACWSQWCNLAGAKSRWLGISDMHELKGKSLRKTSGIYAKSVPQSAATHPSLRY